MHKKTKGSSGNCFYVFQKPDSINRNKIDIEV